MLNMSIEYKTQEKDTYINPRSNDDEEFIIINSSSIKYTDVPNTGHQTNFIETAKIMFDLCVNIIWS